MRLTSRLSFTEAPEHLNEQPGSDCRTTFSVRFPLTAEFGTSVLLADTLEPIRILLQNMK